MGDRVTMSRYDESTGDFEHFMDAETAGGDSIWVCGATVNRKDDVSTVAARIMAIGAGNSASLREMVASAGYGARSLSLGVVRGVNGPQESALKFPCRTMAEEKVTIVVHIRHSIDEYAADARRERVQRISVGYVRDIARRFLEARHPCQNIAAFPSGEFESSPFRKGVSPEPSTG
ncbi:hypothetical protein N566_20120 [Streptomycetaceae bacterium MP113-05]|nr:hypothetical protein N566_20120 [Streptomycetaceae bacterium MP113-05]